MTAINLSEHAYAPTEHPWIRPRRLRDNPLLRDAIAETYIHANHLMLPLFVADNNHAKEITNMPGVMQHSIASLVQEIDELVNLGLRSFILFGVPNEKSSSASAATDPNGIIPRALRAIREKVGDSAFLATDVCLCSYTDTGHCGIMKNNRVDNDSSVDLLAQVALSHAKAGANMVAPSDMMDGRIAAIRETLDGCDYSHIPIMSYAVKYASSLYGPFRHAAGSAPQFGDRKGYQMDFRNKKEALREALLDIEEGADILMVKPALTYLDIIRDLDQNKSCHVPLAAYQVSGEYAMIRYAAAADAIDEERVVLESWIAMRRAGANVVLTYHAADAVRKGWLSTDINIKTKGKA